MFHASRTTRNGKLRAGGQARQCAVTLPCAVRRNEGPLTLPSPTRGEGFGRTGVTLIELLIVMTILLMVTAAALPLMAPALQNRRGREAALLVSSFISGARSRAIETGRPVGVMLERFNGNPFAMSLAYVEVPPPYGGDITGATCTVTYGSSTTSGIYTVYSFTINFPAGFTSTLVRAGDHIRVNSQGPLFLITVVNPGSITATCSFPTSTPAIPATTLFPWTATSLAVPYQIFRQPLRSASQPLQLPDNIVVDLLNSGIGTAGQFTTVSTLGFNPVFTFAPGGALDYVDNGSGLARPTGAVYLLIGRRDQMPDAAPTGRLPTPTSTVAIGNLNDPDGIWITVGYQTGLVASAENNITGTVFTTPATVMPANISFARSFAQAGQSMGGR